VPWFTRSRLISRRIQRSQSFRKIPLEFSAVSLCVAFAINSNPNEFRFQWPRHDFRVCANWIACLLSSEISSWFRYLQRLNATHFRRINFIQLTSNRIQLHNRGFPPHSAFGSCKLNNYPVELWRYFQGYCEYLWNYLASYFHAITLGSCLCSRSISLTVLITVFSAYAPFKFKISHVLIRFELDLWMGAKRVYLYELRWRW
jgi:hypothetical protein